MKIIYLNIDDDIREATERLFNDYANLMFYDCTTSLIKDIEEDKCNKFCVTLDADKEGPETLNLCAILRARRTPVIFVTNDYSIQNRMRLLSLGASFVIGKPFSCEEIIYIVNAFDFKTLNTIITDRNFEIDLINCHIYFNNQRLKLSQQQYALILHFVQNEGIIISRNTLKNTLYSSENDVRFIDGLVCDIRKLTSFNLIETKRGCGYVYYENYVN